MTEPSHFEKAIAVTPIDASTYSANLDPSWCIGKGMGCRSPTDIPHLRKLISISPSQRLHSQRALPNSRDAFRPAGTPLQMQNQTEDKRKGDTLS
jgi:hypothetical protein